MRNFLENMKEKNTIIFFFLTLIIFTIAFDPTHKVDKEVLEHYDKVKHISAFFVLAYFLFESSIILPSFYKFIILSAYAFFIEYVQSMIGREASLNDFIASTSGILIYIGVSYVLKKKL